MKGLMIKIPVIAGFGIAMGAELPVCEEFLGEPAIECVAGDSVAVISTTGEGWSELSRGEDMAVRPADNLSVSTRAPKSLSELYFSISTVKSGSVVMICSLIAFLSSSVIKFSFLA